MDGSWFNSFEWHVMPVRKHYRLVTAAGLPNRK